MSQAQYTNQAEGQSAKPKDLRALVHDMGHWRHAPESGVNLVIISVASALPEAKRTPELIAQMAEGTAGIAAKRAGSCYQVSTCDFAIMAKLPETALIGMVRDLKIDMLRTIERATRSPIEQMQLPSKEAVANRRVAQFKQRIGLKRLADEGFDFEVGAGQQLDRLLQLRRHDQRLRLAQVEAWAQRHRSPP